MKKKFTVFIAVVIMLSLVFTGCSTATPDTTPADKVFKVGINNFGQANFFARIGKASLEDQITKNGGEVIATVNADVPGRVTSIENMISQNVDAIIIQEGDITQLEPVLLEAKKKGIIIGSMGAGDAEFVDVFIESNESDMGAEAAKQMVEAIGGKGKIVEIYNEAGSMIRARRAAMHEVISEYPEIEIVAGFTYAWPDFFPDGKAKMEAVLQANPGQISAVFATFDGVGLAAVQAIREAGLTDEIIVVGVDGDPEAYKEMAKPDSPFIATLAQDPDTMARTLVDNMFELLRGNKISERHIYTPAILITKDNIPEE
ncbi:MAG TPA: sugar ABC transporter substrate-binding protein [Anaerovoracaceae bacterium]|nr:sugar ABC transporter substrate-binding protein [Anaerovoracaceae bacterium]